MRSKYKILLVGFMMLGVVFPACAQQTDTHCLETVWARTNPTEEEKQFDLDNDKSFAEFATYSCDSNVSASEIKQFLAELTNAVNSVSKNGFAEMLQYPFHLYPEEEFTEIKEVAITLENRKQVMEHYDIIANKYFKKLLACSSVDTLVAYSPQMIMIANGYLRIEQDADMSLKLAMVATYNESTSEWYEQYCQ